MLNTLPIKIKFNRLLMLSGLLACILMTGCSLTPTVANIEIPEVANPKSGPAVRIVSVEDRREFGPFVSGQCDRPSVEGDYQDKALTSRVYGRNAQCGRFERANYMLPEGQTISMKIAEVLSNAFRKAGYQVVPQGTLSSDPAAVKVTVEKSWSYYQLEGMGLRYDINHLVSIKVDGVEPIKVEYADSPYYVSFSPLGIGNKTRADFYQESLVGLQNKITAALIKDGGKPPSN